MDTNQQRTAIYYAPVTPEYFLKWEYYQVDLEMLEKCFSKVVICHDIRSFVAAVIFERVSTVYCWWWHQSVVCVAISKIFGIPVFVTGAVHMYDESGSPDFTSKGFLFRFACRLCWRLSTTNLFISQSQYRQITSHEKVNNPHVLRSSLGPDYRRPSKKNAALPHVGSPKLEVRKVRLLTMVWMTRDQIKRKSVYETLDAVKILVDAGVTDIEWVIAGGDANGREELASKISDLDLDAYVILKDGVSNAQKYKLYENSDLYVQPSYYEGFGNAVLEAMSYGLAAVVSRNTAQAEVVGASGYVVEEIDAKSIARVISRYIEQSFEERSQHREMVYRTIEERHLFSYRLERFSELLEHHNQ